MDVQAVLGVAVFLGNEGRIEAVAANAPDVLPHAIIMFIALLSAHAASRWSKSSASIRRALAATIISLLFMSAGV